MATIAYTPARAPALYFVGPSPDRSGGEPFRFRLPCPPAWHDRAPSAWAAERRARRSYFATLDALRTGRVDEDEATKAQRFLADLRSSSARATIAHFLRIIDAVRRSDGQPVIPTPDAPLVDLVVTAPAITGPDEVQGMEARYRWALEWLAARRFVVGRGLRLTWQVRRVTLDGVVVVPAEVRPRQSGATRVSGAMRVPRR